MRPRHSTPGRLLRLHTFALSLAAFGLAPSVQAWDVSLDAPLSDFYVSAWSSPPASPLPWAWVPVQVGASTGVDFNGSIPSSFVFASWTGSQWDGTPVSSSVSLPGFAATAEASWSIDEIDVERPNGANAYVFGNLAHGESMGAQFVYDFAFTLDPNTTATISFADTYANAYLEASAGDEGIAFAGLKLYSSDIDVDDAGGANQAYFEDFVSLIANGTPGTVSRSLSGMDATFENLTGNSQTYQLRLEGYALVFTTPVPEPTTFAMLLAGLGLVGTRVRWRQRISAP